MSRFNFDFDGNSVKTDWVEYFHDFFQYAAGDFTITDTGTSANAVAAGVANGILELVTGATSGNATFLDHKTEAFKWNASKKLYFGARFALADVLATDIVMGLQITDTTPLAVSDGIWFGKDNGDALLDAHVAKASAQTDLNAVATLSNNTYVTAEFYYNGDGRKIELYVNSRAVGSLPIGNAPSEELCVSFGIRTNAAAAKKLSVDWIRVVQER